jgi:hypothetical protein
MEVCDGLEIKRTGIRLEIVYFPPSANDIENDFVSENIRNQRVL